MMLFAVIYTNIKSKQTGEKITLFPIDFEQIGNIFLLDFGTHCIQLNTELVEASIKYMKHQ